MPVNAASAAEVRQAAALVEQTQSKRKVPTALRQRARKLSSTLSGGRRADRVAVSRGSGGALMVSFKQVPVAEMAAFIAALQAHDWGAEDG